MPSWDIVVEEGWPEQPGIPWRVAMDVDPRAATVTLGARVPGTGSLEVQSGAVARTFFPVERGDLAAAAAWLRGEEAAACLAELAGGFTCHVLWSGDPVVTWSEEAWAAGNRLYQGVAARLGGAP